VDVSFADDAREARLPRHQRNRLQIAACHEVRTVRFYADAPDREPREPRTFVEYRVQMRHRHRLRFRNTVNVDELRQNVSDAIAGQMGLRLLDVLETKRRRKVCEAVSV